MDPVQSLWSFQNLVYMERVNVQHYILVIVDLRDRYLITHDNNIFTHEHKIVPVRSYFSYRNYLMAHTSHRMSRKPRPVETQIIALAQFVAGDTLCKRRQSRGGGGGGKLPLKGGHHARLKKRVKRVVFHGRAMYARTVERVSKLPEILKKGYSFQQLRYAFRVYILLIMKIHIFIRV